MKIAGIICLVLGIISLIGCVAGGSNPFGPIFLLGIGIILLYRANAKTKASKDIEDWKNQK